MISFISLQSRMVHSGYAKVRNKALDQGAEKPDRGHPADCVFVQMSTIALPFCIRSSVFTGKRSLYNPVQFAASKVPLQDSIMFFTFAVQRNPEVRFTPIK
jgi:hypothetical protein